MQLLTLLYTFVHCTFFPAVPRSTPPAYHDVATTHYEIKHFISPVLIKEEARRRAKLRWKKACAQVLF
jgi:hypothetical protein